MASRCCAGSMSALPACEMVKCRPFGVAVPWSRWCGVRACDVRGSPFGLLSVRTAAFSNFDGVPYAGTSSPGSLLHGASASGSARAYPVIAAASAAPPRRNARRSSNPFPATGWNFSMRPPPRKVHGNYTPRIGDGARIRSGSVPELVDGQLLDDLAHAQAFRSHAYAALAANRDGDGAARDAAAAALEEDVLVVEPAAPALEVADLDARVARIEGDAALGLELDKHARVERELLGRVEHVSRQIAGVRHLDLDSPLGVARLHLERRRHRSDAQIDRRLALAHLGKHLVRRIAQADGRYGAAQLDLAELRMLETLPRSEDASLVTLAVELCEREQVLARELAVVVDERFLARDAQPRKEVP